MRKTEQDISMMVKIPWRSALEAKGQFWILKSLGREFLFEAEFVSCYSCCTEIFVNSIVKYENFSGTERRDLQVWNFRLLFCFKDNEGIVYRITLVLDPNLGLCSDWFFLNLKHQSYRFLAISIMHKQNRSIDVNTVSDGSPSRIRIVLLISLGITTRPRSSIRRTIPVAFIYKSPLLNKIASRDSVCSFRRIMRKEYGIVFWFLHVYMVSRIEWDFSKKSTENITKRCQNR